MNVLKNIIMTKKIKTAKELMFREIAYANCVDVMGQPKNHKTYIDSLPCKGDQIALGIVSAAMTYAKATGDTFDEVLRALLAHADEVCDMMVPFVKVPPAPSRSGEAAKECFLQVSDLGALLMRNDYVAGAPLNSRRFAYGIEAIFMVSDSSKDRYGTSIVSTAFKKDKDMLEHVKIIGSAHAQFIASFYLPRFSMDMRSRVSFARFIVNRVLYRELGMARDFDAYEVSWKKANV